MSDFERQYQDKLTTTEELVGRFKPGDVVQLGIWYGEPYGTMAAMERQCGDIDPLYVSQSISTSPSNYLDHPGVYGMTSFYGPKERASQKANDNILYTPMQFMGASQLIRNGRSFDYFIFRVTPMDEKGNFNFSLTASWEYNSIRWIKDKGLDTKVVFEVNKNLPRVYGLESFGANELSIDYADIIVEDDSSILDYPTPAASEVEERIAANVMTLVEDRATVQLGFGTLPMAIGKLLTARKELGIHTEMICDAHVELVEAGSVTNAHKGMYDGLSVCTFALGTSRLHEWMTENEACAMLPVEHVNNPAILGKLNNLTAINSVLAVDMTGQACAHCLMADNYSGVGGAMEFTLGSQMSPGGKSMLCLPSTTTLRDGTVVSNIVAQFPAGTRVTIPEHCTEWVVTEFGAVRLKFMALEQRAAALISIAHPDFRDELAQQMADAGLRLDRAALLPSSPPEFFSKA